MVESQGLGANFCYSVECISKELDQKWGSWDTKQHPHGIPAHARQGVWATRLPRRALIMTSLRNNSGNWHCGAGAFAAPCIVDIPCCCWFESHLLHFWYSSLLKQQRKWQKRAQMLGFQHPQGDAEAAPSSWLSSDPTWSLQPFRDWNSPLSLIFAFQINL